MKILFLLALWGCNEVYADNNNAPFYIFENDLYTNLVKKHIISEGDTLYLVAYLRNIPQKSELPCIVHDYPKQLPNSCYFLSWQINKSTIRFWVKIGNVYEDKDGKNIDILCIYIYKYRKKRGGNIKLVSVEEGGF